MTHHSPRRQRVTAAATAGGTLTATLALLLGMPYILWQATGVPWPEHIMSWSAVGERLTQPLSDPLLVELLALAGWLCWAAFAWTVLRETYWYATNLPQLLRDRTAHDEHVAALSARNSLAALCVGTLVLALIGLWRPTAGAHQSFTANEPWLHHTAATAPVELGSAERAARLGGERAGAGTPGAPPRQPGSPAQTEAVDGAGAAQHFEYTVVEGDTLWDIAHVHLDDPCKWPRIYALNKNRVQSDGTRLSDPDLIRPGWRLAIPVTGTDTSRPHQPDPAAPAPAHPEQPVETPPAQPTPAETWAPEHHRDDKVTPSAPAHQDSAPRNTGSEPGPAAVGIGEAGLIGITAAAGLLAARRYWYVQQHRQRRPEKETQSSSLSPIVDKAAQAARAAAQPPCPQDPEALFTRRTPPQPPRSPSTVTIGQQDNSEVPLDVLATTAGCFWSGPGAEGAARALLTGILTAAERQRPSPARVTAVVTADLAERLLPGLPPTFTALTQSADTAHALRAAELHLLAHARACQDQEAELPEAASTPTSPAVREAAPGTLLLLTAPGPAHHGQLQALAVRSRPDTLIVLTLDTALPGAERWDIAADGSTSLPHGHASKLDRLQLFHLTPEAGRDMTEVLLGAHGQRRHLRILPNPSPPPRTRQTEAADEPGTDPLPKPADRQHAEQPTQTKPVRIHVLGPVTLYARGHPDPIGTNLRPEVHEFLALLAAHPAGLLASDIAEKLHLDGNNDQNALKNLRRAVRRALRAATGITTQEFILRHGELHKLHPELVETDLAEFEEILNGLPPDGTPGTLRRGDLNAACEAIARYRGTFAQGRDYLWADAIREHLTMKATDAVLRIAHRAEHTEGAVGERDVILSLLEHLSTVHPDHERLAQHAIRLYQAAGRHDAARHTYTRLKRELDELGLEPEPATRALVMLKANPRKTR
ncbi:BTAD domain-containing putative transcriptional regulator [Streptomyces lycii]|uniref:LysM peptidoglycan-binding domain-containing protein n=1 Tax=Streptomyces lycii TaxID=2654337 RepID=A0ABQ7FCT1_9ACTN|nr:BTAD domain-containing putative transcriptional regulator [Streptomyces lycii]KAF4406811.1 LysM peptidoglycan-binding domain-containing protein [Streptomyces lycii]